jgi:hypothetical protein
MELFLRPPACRGLILRRMSDNLPPSDQESIGARFSAAPLELRMYAVFAAVVSVLGCGLAAFGPKSLIEAIVPFTGWGAGTNYAFTLFFAFALIFAKKMPRRAGMIWRFAIIAILLISIFEGYQEMKRPAASDFGNPYLRISPLRPVWTIIIPAFWMLMLLSSRMKKFLMSRDASSAA